MQITLNADWAPFSEGDPDEQLKIAGYVAYVYDDDGWWWEVRRDDRRKKPIIAIEMVEYRADHTDTGCKEEAKAAAEEIIRKLLQPVSD